jgi:hypothetical protein
VTGEWPLTLLFDMLIARTPKRIIDGNGRCSFGGKIIIFFGFI